MINETAVYVALIPEDVEPSFVFPPERQAEIDRCSNPRVRQEKYFVWKLLEHALRDHFDIDVTDMSFSKNENGKWVSDTCFFSLSHSDRVAAVAVSQTNVGVDVEAVRRYRDGIEERILSESEKLPLPSMDTAEAEAYIIEKWSQKESIFKTLDKKVFEPTRLNTADHPVRSYFFELSGRRYALSVCAQDADKAKINLNGDIWQK
ncbi:MAG: 4'-phosphopantetheinyl transferase superfamily protein [Clostridia bacterium]|nr:4'-phosphopantetheinyl transferase superfamily protein [Clostridia bacterium]